MHARELFVNLNVLLSAELPADTPVFKTAAHVAIGVITSSQIIIKLILVFLGSTNHNCPGTRGGNEASMANQIYDKKHHREILVNN